jgi:hypothetical protein
MATGNRLRFHREKKRERAADENDKKARATDVTLHSSTKRKKNTEVSPLDTVKRDTHLNGR